MCLHISYLLLIYLTMCCLDRRGGERRPMWSKMMCVFLFETNSSPRHTVSYVPVVHIQCHGHLLRPLKPPCSSEGWWRWLSNQQFPLLRRESNLLLFTASGVIIVFGCELAFSSDESGAERGGSEASNQNCPSHPSTGTARAPADQTRTMARISVKLNIQITTISIGGMVQSSMVGGRAPCGSGRIWWHKQILLVLPPSA